MYLYIPIDKRSIVVARHTISSTGMAFPERVAELDSVLGTLLDRHDEGATPATVLEPETIVPAVEEVVVPAVEEPAKEETAVEEPAEEEAAVEETVVSAAE